MAQAITAGASLLITRLYSPADLGQLGLFVSFLLVASVTTSLRYDSAIPTPADDGEAAQLAVAAMTLVVPVVLVATVAFVGLIAMDVAGFGLLPGWTIPLMAVALAAFGVMTVLRFWEVRRGRFRVVAQIAVVQSAGRAATQIALGLVTAGSAGLIAGETVGRCLGWLRLYRASMPEIRIRSRAWARPGTLHVLSRYRRFPSFGLPSALINALALYAPVPLMVQLYGIEAGGSLLLVQRVVSVPLAVVGSAIADVFHARLAASAHAGDDRAQSLLARSAMLLMAIGLPLAVLVIVFSRPAFPFVFGSEWSQAGSMATALAPWALAQFVTYPVSRSVLVFEAQSAKLIFDVATLVGAVGALLIASGPLALDATRAVGLLALVQACLYAGLLGILWRVVSARSARSVQG